MGRVIFVTAFKGGVGKTTVSAGLACALATLGKRVCVLDADFGMRCMDLVLGMEDAALYDCYDVLTGNCEPGAAIVSVNGYRSLWFAPAPIRYSGDPLPRERADAFFAYLREQFDFCIVDSSAELSDYYRLFADESDEAVVVTLHQSTAIRAAEKTAANLASFGFRNVHLAVNCYRDEEARKGNLPGLAEIIYRSSVALLGAVPFSDRIQVDQEARRLPFTGRDYERLRPYEAAYLNIALRVLGVWVPLREGIDRPERKKKALKKARGQI
ncbi:MAG: P-loop NTPase [Clostridia bacterium]|nr:P-loop NTPase [Clostridia bacterium]